MWVELAKKNVYKEIKPIVTKNKKKKKLKKKILLLIKNILKCFMILNL